jgi:hypothetical protein
MDIVGRDREQDQLSTFVQNPLGRALVLRGETGVGKSALLDFTADLAAAEGHLVIRAVGVEAESGLPYAGVHQLAYPLLQNITGLDETTQAVFDAIVDDGQWLDEAAADVCGFVGRRLAGSAVKLLVAIRADIASRFDTAALPESPVAPLSADGAARLLDRRHPTLGRQVRQVVLDQAQGNPLALIELPAHAEAAPEDLLERHGIRSPGVCTTSTAPASQCSTTLSVPSCCSARSTAHRPAGTA